MVHTKIKQLHIDYMLMGVEKAGTTSMIAYLLEHPQVCRTKRGSESAHFFNIYFNKGTDWYKGWLRIREGLIGERCHDYFYFPRAPMRIKQVSPDTKFILMLRNPVDRAYSHYQDNFINPGDVGKSFMRESLSFEEALLSEESRIIPERKKVELDEDYYQTCGIKYPWDVNSYSIHAYKAKGRYDEQLENWLKYFPLEQMIIIKSEDFFENPEKEYLKIQDFLEIECYTLRRYENHRPGGKNGRGYEPMQKKTREDLVEYFKPHNERLYKMINRNMGWK